MDSLIIASTDETPAIDFQPATNKFEISGKSLPEDVTSFYGPVLDWLNGYADAPNASTTLVFKMVYFNTASSKMILDIMMKMEEISENGNAVTIRWYYQEDDEDMEEAGEEYAELVDLSFEMEPY